MRPKRKAGSVLPKGVLDNQRIIKIPQPIRLWEEQEQLQWPDQNIP